MSVYKLSVEYTPCILRSSLNFDETALFKVGNTIIEGKEIEYYPMSKHATRSYKKCIELGKSVDWYLKKRKIMFIRHYYNCKYHGNIIQMSFKGVEVYNHHYKNGKKDGRQIDYGIHGDVIYSTYKNDVLNGPFEKYVNNIKICYEYYIDGLLDGDRYEYDSNGKLRFAMSYVKGLKHGTLKVLYKNGNIKFEAEYSNGLLHGNAYHYYDDGTKSDSYTYENGLLNGLHISYHSTYGFIHMTCYYYDNNSKITYQITFRNSLKHGNEYRYLENGIVDVKSYENDRLNGLSYKIDKDGKIFDKVNFHKDEIVDSYESTVKIITFIGLAYIVLSIMMKWIHH